MADVQDDDVGLGLDDGQMGFFDPDEAVIGDVQGNIEGDNDFNYVPESDPPQADIDDDNTGNEDNEDDSEFEDLQLPVVRAPPPSRNARIKMHPTLNGEHIDFTNKFNF